MTRTTYINDLAFFRSFRLCQQRQCEQGNSGRRLLRELLDIAGYKRYPILLVARWSRAADYWCSYCGLPNQQPRERDCWLTSTWMIIPCITMTGTRPAFYKIPVTAALSTTVTTRNCLHAITNVVGCRVPSRRAAEGMESPIYRKKALKHLHRGFQRTCQIAVAGSHGLIGRCWYFPGMVPFCNWHGSLASVAESSDKMVFILNVINTFV